MTENCYELEGEAEQASDRGRRKGLAAGTPERTGLPKWMIDPCAESRRGPRARGGYPRPAPGIDQADSNRQAGTGD
jgi:hypothetical protein